MKNLIHFYYQNKQKILKVVIIIALVIIIIQLLNYWAKLNKNSTLQNTTNTTTSINKLSTKNETYIKNTSVVTGQEITETQSKVINETINTFLEYCNNKEPAKAYDMLSVECKENLYQTEQDFINNYYSKNFTGNDTFTIENWIGDTYRVKIQEDMLATGKVNNQVVQDYITIVQQGGENKLNINSYIGREEINKEVSNKNIYITVISKDVYMEYEIYKFTITNRTNNRIMIDSLEDTKSIYLEGDNSNKYIAYSYELLQENMILQQNFTTNISIKFAKSYSTNSSVNKIVFSNIILNYKATNAQEESYTYTIDI